mmetsp:Transcript_109593/g.275670  ORF Transcript_109593/g.275670 Transcript_109593/m.275670 type:complete len:525 (+) Transcript_109593:30-1604(+)
MNRLLWIRSEAFDHGVFNTSVRWTVPKVQDFLASFRETISAQSIARETWVEIATTRCKPTLSEAEATAYWHVFVVLQQAIFKQKVDGGLDFRVISLLLMCQVFSPHRVRTDQFAMSGEMWPGLERATAVSSPRHSPRGTSPRVGVSAQTSIQRGRDASTAMLAFVRQHVGYFLQVACASPTAEPAAVSSEEFDILGLLLCGDTAMQPSLKRLSDAIPDLASKKSMPFKEIKRMVDKLLVWNDEMYTSVEQSLGVQAPVEPGGTKVINVSGMQKTTWFQRPPNGDIDVLSITCCNECTIYVTGQARFCCVAGCHDCTIVVPAVAGLCTIHNCEKISIHVAAHCFKMENSIDSSAYLYCHIPPILTGDTRGIKLAPFNVLYSQIATALKNADMPLEREYVDVWAHPVCCTLGAPDETLGRSGNIDQPTNSTYHFVHPENFQPVVIPEQGRRGPQVPLCLPQVYDDAIKSREEEMRAFQRMMAEVSDESKRRRAHQAIQGHFREWLQATGKSRQLADLARMAQQDVR